MPRKRQSEMVEGFDVFKALGSSQKQADWESRRRKPEHRPDTQSRPEGDREGPRVASHIGHTTLPPKHELVCFECGYSFQITGKIDSILCPKCRVDISLRNVTIDKDWVDDVKTGGTIEIKKTGVVKGCSLVAKEVILDGRVESGSINAYQQIVVQPNGEYSEELIEARDLVVAPLSKLVLKKTAYFRNVDIAGSLCAEKLCVEELASVKSGGLLDGVLHAKRLRIEEGGGLKATVNVGSNIQLGKRS